MGMLMLETCRGL